MKHENHRLKIASAGLSAEIATLGAELQNLSDAEGRRLQWDGDPTVWAGRAPILFPVIGVLRDGAYQLDGRRHAMPKHGFARVSTFEVVSHAPDRAVLRLATDAATRAAYPFEFQLDVDYALAGNTMRMLATVSNLGGAPMPASIGFHPALRWPLPFGEARAGHAIRFADPEPAPIRKLDADGFLLPDPRPTPVAGDVLALHDGLFVDDAVIFDRLTSREVSYGASHGPRVTVAFDGFTALGVWSKVGADFVCIEPWQGFADPVGFDGEIWDKPGIVAIAAGASRTFTMTITVVDSAVR